VSAARPLAIDGRSRRAGRPRPGSTLALLALLWLATLIAAPLAGSHDLDLGRAFEPGTTEATILWQLRLPRVLLALAAGGALAVAGLAFQTLFRNGLAEPYTLGVAGGAALGAVLALHLAAGAVAAGSLPGFTLVAAASFAGAVAASALVVGLALRPGGIETGTLLLAGIAVSFSCSALILFIQYLSDFTQTYRIVRWMMGGLAVAGYREVGWVAAWVAAGTALVLALRWDLNLLLTGEELAASRGVDLARVRLLVLGAASMMVGALVSVTGPIGFVGLIVPHVLRRWAGSDHLVLVPACLLGGGVFLALCDLAARTVMAPAELPVGVLTALLGGPFFLWLLLVRKAR
jgi:iron complex transport system permease protein